MKLSIIYHSESENTKTVAGVVAQGAMDRGLDVKCMSIEEVDIDYVVSSDVVLFGTPTYMGTMSWQMKKFIDTELGPLKLSGKLGGVFATENFLGGGADFAEISILAQLLVKGMLIYSGGAAKGKPYTHFGAVSIQKGNEFEQERARLFGERMAEKGVELFGKNE